MTKVDFPKQPDSEDLKQPDGGDLKDPVSQLIDRVKKLEERLRNLELAVLGRHFEDA